MHEDDATGDAAQSAAERLLEHSWEARDRRASQRELIVEATSATLFVAGAAALMVISGQSATVRPGIAALLIAVYALVARIEFAVGAGSVVPTQVVLVPMIVMLPPAAVPPAVALGLVGSSIIDWALGRATARRILTSVPDAWHAMGPALLLYLIGSPKLDVTDIPLLAAALGAACLFDLASTVARVWLTGLVLDLPAQIRVMGLVWTVDATLAPLGFLAAITMRHSDAAILSVLPIVFLLWLLARDRNQRIAQAHRRLKLVQQERARLQSAVRRLGDAFAAKLDLDGLLEILLHGSLEALDAAAGRIDIGSGPAARSLTAGSAESLVRLSRYWLGAAAPEGPVQVTSDGAWTLSLWMTIGATPDAGASLHFLREGRAFAEDEIKVIAELIAKAELSAADILAHHTIREQALTDALTGLGNRRKLSADLADTLAGAAAGEPSALLLFDLDGFKNYNDTFGHLAGDALLARLGARLEAAVRAHGAAYRLGGDEFCAHLHLDGTDSHELISRAATSLNESGSEFSIRASLGVVLLPHEADSPDHALQIADERMYADKRSRPDGARNQAREVLLRTMHAKQPDLDQHSSNVAALATRVARQLGLSGETLDEIGRAAELHDVGKVGIPDAILNKPAALSAEEWTFMHQHTILGERILHGAPALRPVAQLVRASHERWDGTGYPDRLRGEEIPLGARIVSVCDAYEAMTTDRAYRQAISSDDACRELADGAGTQFDPAVVTAFVTIIRSAPSERQHDATHDAAAHIQTLLAHSADHSPVVVEVPDSARVSLAVEADA